MAKIDIISGFLGAGKTTLIKKLIKESLGNEKLVLIENEFGEIGIDGGFLKEAGVEVTEMNSGCICCSLVGDFGTALKEVLATYQPDRVIIEPSGVGKLSDVIKAVQGVNEDVEIYLNSTTAVVDATKAAMYMKNFGEFFNNQIESAKTIVLSRTQNMTMEKLDKCVHALKEHNENAVIITTPWESLEGSQILKAMEQEHSLLDEIMKEEEICPECGHHHDHEHECCGHDHEHHHEHGHHHADDVFTSWGTETPHKFAENNVKEMLEKLANGNEYGIILRAKGILPAEDGTWIHFDLVPGEYEVRKGTADYTGRLCVIGTNLDTNKIQELFGI